MAQSAAEPHFVRSIELAEALSPFERARNELLYGEWLRRERRRVDARPHLRAALELFQRLALPPWEERARSELRASGETARRRDPSTRDQLTPQELQIAHLVSEGRTNREIGAQLLLEPAHDRLPPAQGVRQAADRLPRRPGADRPRRARLRLTGDPTGDFADATGPATRAWSTHGASAACEEANGPARSCADRRSAPFLSVSDQGAPRDRGARGRRRPRTRRRRRGRNDRASSRRRPDRRLSPPDGRTGPRSSLVCSRGATRDRAHVREPLGRDPGQLGRSRPLPRQGRHHRPGGRAVARRPRP